MYIEKIKLSNFRNYKEEEIDFNKNINIMYGDNAQGKTNILEAIFISALGKSFRTNKDEELIKKNEKKGIVEISVKKEDREKQVKIEISEKKRFLINSVQIKKISDILGNIYVVLFIPEDIGIIKNEPIRRRKFLNIMISQLRPNYVNLINQYKKILEQRNYYLKQIKYENKKSENLDIWDKQLVEIGIKIYNYREEFLEKINEKIKKIHYNTTQEDIIIKYKTNIKNDFLKELIKKRREDIEKGYTTVGIHRDDFEIIINDEDVSIYGSQGQKRTAIISLKLAEAEVLYEETGEYPIILLDDFMSELDKKRIKGFLENIKNNQVIITCTENFKMNSEKCGIYEINNAKVKCIKNK